MAAFACLCTIAGLLIVASRHDDPQPIDSTVIHVIDGDTIELADHTIVRMIGVNTPETVDPNAPVECYGHEASAYTRYLLQGMKVHVILGTGESYDRKLGYVYVEGHQVNRILVALGYAYDEPIDPNTSFAREYHHLAQRARSLQLGLWAVCYHG